MCDIDMTLVRHTRLAYSSDRTQLVTLLMVACRQMNINCKPLVFARKVSWSFSFFKKASGLNENLFWIILREILTAFFEKKCFGHITSLGVTFVNVII